MLEQETLKEAGLSEPSQLLSWCLCQTPGDMCVADTSIEQSSNSMEQCTREDNDSTATPDVEPAPDSAGEGACNEIRIAEVYTLGKDSPAAPSNPEPDDETSEAAVMIIDDDDSPRKASQNDQNYQKTETKKKEIEKKTGEDVQVIEISEVESEADEVSAEVISEIDAEILKSLKGTFKNLKTLISGIQSDTGSGGERKRPNSGPVFGTSASGQKGKAGPKAAAVSSRRGSDQRRATKVNGEPKRKDDSFAKTDNAGNDSWSWKVEHYGNVLEDDRNKNVKSLGVTEKRNSTEEKKRNSTEERKRNSTEEKSTDDSSKDEKSEEEVVWICFVCAKEFNNQQELMLHQDTCDEDLPEPAPCDPHADSPNTADLKPDLVKHDPAAGDSSDGNSGVPIITHVSATERVAFNSPLSNPGFSLTDSSNPVPAHLTKVGSGIKSLPLGLPRRRKIQRKKFVKEIYIPPPRDKYFECLGLGQTPAMDEIFKSPRKSVSEDDCAIIDLTVEDASAQHSAPMTPRTRSLMSQLSRDESGRRRQLSFSGTPVKSDPKPATKPVEVEKKSDSSDSESSESSEEESVKRKSVPFKSALLAIALTSPLGQRLKNHWQNENKVPVISDVETFCKTDGITEIAQELLDNKKKNPVLEKLRHRPPPQVTFKFTKKYLNKWFHKYKFNSLDRREFQKILKTGLERESRRRAKRTKPCKVLLQRLSKKDIKYWTTPRVRPAGMRYLQCFRQINPNTVRFRPKFPNAGNMLRYNRPMHQRMLMLNQLNRRLAPPILQRTQPNSPIRFQQARMPTPQLLVRPHGGGVGMRLEVMNINQGYAAVPVQFTDNGRSQKRKQTFDNVRRDDNLVICLSSDEEEEPKKGSTQCAQCVRGLCSIHQRVKPVSVTPSPARLVSLLPTNSQGHTVKGASVSDSASSRVFGNSFLQGAGNSKVAPVKPSGSDFTSVRMVNGQMYLQSPQASTSQGQRSQATPSQNVTLKEEPGSKEKGPVAGSSTTESVPSPAGSNRSQSDSEYMDYEVICIESDEED